MICPHCLKHIHFPYEDLHSVEVIVVAKKEIHEVYAGECPSCEGPIIVHVYGPAKKIDKGSWSFVNDENTEQILYPKSTGRKPIPPEVPDKYSDDYKEACIVLQDSPKASAALSRRVLQTLLHDHLNIKARSLEQEIQTLLNTGNLPSYIADALDAVRTVGNFAAHPIKDQHTGEIVPVEPGEAEWLIEVLELLFDFYFVQPAQQQKRRAEINKKLAAAGKPPMK